MSIIVKKKNPITHSVKVALLTLAVFALLGFIVKIKRDKAKIPHDVTQQSVKPLNALPYPLSNALFIPTLFLNVDADAPESVWNLALTQYLNGESEVSVEFGRIDVLTTNYAIEIDFLPKWQEGIGQALHYSDATKRTPCLALISTSDRPDLEKIKYIDELCRKKGITLLLISPKTKETASQPEH